MMFFIEGCVPGEEEVVGFEVNTVLHCGRIRSSALERHNGFNVDAHQLPVQILQTPVIWKHTHRLRVFHNLHAKRDEWCCGGLNLALVGDAGD